MLYKVTLVGCSGVGKSSFINQFVNRCFSREHLITQKSELYTTRRRIKDEDCVVQLEDSKGCDTMTFLDFLNAAPLQYEYDKNMKLKRADIPREDKEKIDNVLPRQAFMLMYDVRNRTTLEEVSRVVDELFQHMNFKENSGVLPIPIVLTANKVDVREQDREVTKEEGQKFASDNNLAYVEVSVSRNTGVLEAIETVLDRIDSVIAVVEKNMLSNATVKVSCGSIPFPEKDGWLEKRGHLFKTWRRRWFVLKDSYVYYYEDPAAKQAKGFFTLKGAKFRIPLMTEKCYKENCLEIVTASKTYYLAATSFSELHSWIEVFRNAA
eukprot:GCRY01003137.1.p1 GENE.GCRY01003137.1~~GCRY01003137.1.p1  ORF type:complete len:364 (+),score=32.71 GCRY01003137.1:125-1093(+)